MAERWLQQGREQGREQGLEQGLRRGREEGQRQMLEKQLRRRFGDLSPAALDRLASASAADLDLMGERVLDASSLEEALDLQS